MTRQGNVLEVQGLTVEYRAGNRWRRVLDGFGVALEPGECVGLAGPSGCGKTTVVNGCLRLLPPGGRIAAGAIRFRGQDLTKATERELGAVRGAGLALVSQEPASALDPVRRVGFQVCETMRIHGLASADEAKRRGLDMMERVGLTNPAALWNEVPHRLSGGQRQRVALAAALAARPAVLFADEPTTALDAALRLRVLDLLTELRRETGLAVLLISHDSQALERRADRIVRLAPLEYVS